MIRFWAVGLLFWPVLLAGVFMGHWLAGIIAGLAAVLAGELLSWRFTFGEWPNMLDPPQQQGDNGGSTTRHMH